MRVSPRHVPHPDRPPSRAAVHFLRRRRVVAAGIGATLAKPAPAQAPWPRQPVRMLVGFPPGGGLDLAARLLSNSLSAALGQPFLVENRTGANGYLATESAARASDGHTLLFGNPGALAIHNALFPAVPIDTLRDLTPVAMITETPMFFAIAPSLPVTTLAGFVAHARANPGRLSFGSNGVGSGSHLIFERFRRDLGLDISHVPYRGMAQALPDLAAGRIHMVLDAYFSIRGAEEAGQARMVAVTTLDPVPWRTELPTVAAAAGLPGWEVQGWMALMAPATIPSAVLRRLEAETARALGAGALGEALLRHGLPPRFRGSDEARAFIAAERARYGALIRQARITAQD